MCLIEQEGVEERAVFHRVRFPYFEFVPTVHRFLPRSLLRDPKMRLEVRREG